MYKCWCKVLDIQYNRYTQCWVQSCDSHWRQMGLMSAKYHITNDFKWVRKEKEKGKNKTKNRTGGNGLYRASSKR